MSANNGRPTPVTYIREHQTCNRCPKCHPGKSYSVLFCRIEHCPCHRRPS